MREIWYLLKCPKESEADYTAKCRELVEAGSLKEVVCFQYQRMMRYGGQWHVESRTLLPGYIFLSGSKTLIWKKGQREGAEAEKEISLTICSPPSIKELCRNGNLVGMSRGIIKDGTPVVTSGPLRGREELIRHIDRHKRTAEIRIPIDGQEKLVTVGLEIYQKQ